MKQRTSVYKKIQAPEVPKQYSTVSNIVKNHFMCI